MQYTEHKPFYFKTKSHLYANVFADHRVELKTVNAKPLTVVNARKSGVVALYFKLQYSFNFIFRGEERQSV